MSVRRDEVTRWIREHARPLATAEPGASTGDLAALRSALSGALIVGVGGTTYGGHEQFTLTDRIVRHLVDDLGFRSVATEEDWGVGLEFDRYVVTGEGDLDDLMKRAGIPWRNQEMRDALEWMRRYNATHPDPVRFVGVGCIDTRPAVYDSVTGYVERAAPDRLAELNEHFAIVRPDRPDWTHWFIGQVKEKEPYVERARQVCRLVEELPRVEGHEMVLQNARQIVAFYEHYTHHLIDDGYRDLAMAENLRWWHEHTNDRIAYWSTSAHSAVAGRLEVRVPPRPGLTFTTTGAHLRERYGKRYVSIGITFDHGTVNSGWALPPFTARPLPAPPEPDGFAERLLGDAGLSQYVLDLNELDLNEPGPPEDVRQWLHGPARTRIIGSIYDPENQPAEEYAMTGGSLAEWFDVIIHRQELTPTRSL